MLCIQLNKNFRMNSRDEKYKNLMKNKYYHQTFYPKHYENYLWRNNHKIPYDEYWDNEISNYSLFSKEHSEYFYPHSKFQNPGHISNITTQTYESDFNKLLDNEKTKISINGTNEPLSELKLTQIQLNKNIDFLENYRNIHNF